MIIKNTFALAVAFLISVAVLAVPSKTEAHDRPHLPSKPCASEDSVNCFWDAGRRGNGKGFSFWVDRHGNVTYLDPRKN
ncbi:hypothetical protein [Actinocorallia libanotica]|uniref:Peptidase inhibitor family I36 n=1 Tax=Actinocorallia libanotica TaxID=46162 RepID=A0ABN1QQV3_9ACTN